MTTTMLPRFAYKNNILVVYVHARLAVNDILKDSLKEGAL
jgi:hypothetical protein